MEINIIPKFIDEAAAPPARSIGDTLSNLWELGIGSHVNLWVQKQEFKHQKNLQLYKEKIEEKTQSIPEENLVEPQMNIVGPAIEASKYYIDSQELREMFANLIAASIDNRKIGKAHPSFVEIIKQMSPLDAQNLILYKNVYQFPIAEYRLIRDKGGGFNTQFTNVFLENKKVNDLDLIASSLENLSRLGVILITYENYITADNFYDEHKETNIYNDLQYKLATGQFPNDKKVEVQQGLTKSTPLGKDFIKICLS